MGGSSSQTLGYKFFMGVQYAVSFGEIDALTQIQAGEREAWAGNVTASGEIAINAPDLFGGEKKEGGIQGTASICMGELTQLQNDYLVSQLGSDIPAYRGIFTVVYRGLISALTPYIKPWSFKVRRILKGWDGPVWYPAKAAIGTDMNPAHIVYECLTNRQWGMGYPTSIIDATNFQAAADVLFAEGFGLSMLWNQSDQIKNFVQLIMNQIGGTLRVDRKTGLYNLKLIRDDYVFNSLPVVNVSNSGLVSWQRAALGETANEVTIAYTNSSTGQESYYTENDISNIDAQGGTVINRKNQYQGITSDTLAIRVAKRDLRVAATPLTKATIKVNRQGWSWMPSDVIRLVHEKMGIDAAYRIVTINWGDLNDNEITIDLAEDIFGLPSATYSAQQPVGWIDPSNAPAASPVRLITETPYYEIARTLTATDLATIDSTDALIDVYAKKPSSDAFDYNLFTAVGAAALTQKATGSHPGTLTTTAAMIREEFSVIPIADSTELSFSEPAIGSLLIIDGEWMRLDAYNVALKTVSVARGALDTIPVAHVTGSTIWLATGNAGRDGVQYLTGDIVKVKVQTKTGRGVLNIASAPQDTLVMTSRQAKPLPPGRIRIGGAYPGDSFTGPLLLAWAGRNRITQTASVIAQDATNIAPETGTTYSLKISGEAGAVLNNTSETGTALTWDESTEKSVSTVYDASANRDLRLVGLGKVVSTVGNNLTLDMQKVLSGWMRVQTGTIASGQSARYVDGTTGAITNREFSPSWLTANTYNMFPLNPSVYQSYISNDTYAGWAVKRAVSNPATDNTPISLLTPFDQVRGTVRDRRKTSTAQILLVDSFATLQYWVSNASAQRYISRRQYALHRVKRADVVTGPLVSTRTTLYDAYIADLAQFDTPSFTSNAASPLNIKGIIPNLCVIFGSLLYVYADRVTAVTNTSGKAVNITNAISSHIDIATAVTTGTYRFTIDTDGNITPLATRSGHYLADQVTASGGVEILGGSITTVDITTGVTGSVIATLPGGTTATQVVGDTVNNTFFVLAANLNIYKYSIAGALLATISYPSGYDKNTNQFFVTAGFLYLAGSNGYILRYAKDLSTFAAFELSKILSYDPDNIYFSRSSSYPDETQFIAINLLDESSASTATVDAPTKRLNDTLRIELGASRNGLDSYTKHDVTVKRFGMGLRMGEYMG